MNDAESPTFASVARVRSLGGSDAAPACGVDVYGRNRITLWRELVGIEPRRDVTSRPIRRGVTLEDWIANEYALERGVRVRRRRKPIRSERFPFMHATIDRRVAGTGVILECKSVHPLAKRPETWGDAGTDEVPIHYLLQCVHYNIVADADRTDLAAMFGDELRVYHIPRNAELEARVVELEHELWESARTGVEPEPMTAAEVRSLYPGDDGSSLLATPELVETVERLKAARAEVDAAEEKVAALRETIELALGESATLIAEDGRPLVTWKKAKDSARTEWRRAVELALEGFGIEGVLGAAWQAGGAHDALAFAAWCATGIVPGSRRFLVK